MKRMNRVPYFVLLHTLTAGLLPATAPSVPMGPEVLKDAPAAEEIAFFEDLVGWIDSEPDPERPLRLAIRRSSSFDLFREYHGGESYRVLLDELPYGEAIRAAASRNGVDALLIASVVEAESGFDPRAVSPRGAVGLMQLMPGTAEIGPESLTEPVLNLDLGCRYLRRLLERYRGDLELTLAAYNAGPANVKRYGGLPPFRETESYVERVLRIYVGHHRSLWQESEIGEFLISG